MTIEQEAFRKYNLDEKKTDTFTVWLNKDERIWLNNAKKILEQPKDSTALKTLAEIGAKQLGNDTTMFILGKVFKNKRNNLRTGLQEIG